uniref:Uncharacterized protein n=1 Tax=Panagrolaimus sp. JU765 TaxID=591449 RepID=A0AC34QSF9_9BILA
MSESTARDPTLSEQSKTAQEPGDRSDVNRTAREPGCNSDPNKTAQEPGCVSDPNKTAKEPGNDSDPNKTAREPGAESERKDKKSQDLYGGAVEEFDMTSIYPTQQKVDPATAAASPRVKK